MANTHTVIGSFGCESYTALAWHLAYCHWNLSHIPDGLIKELQGLTTLGVHELEGLRKQYAHQVPAEAVSGWHLP